MSPRLGTRFDLAGTGLRVHGPDGERFLSYQELIEQRQTERLRAEQERLRAEQERLRAEQERLRATRESERAERLAAQLRALGVTPAD